MGLNERIESWIALIQEQIDSAKEIPSINTDGDWPWIADAASIFQDAADGGDVRQELYNIFRKEPANLYRRFVGLHLYGVLWMANFYEPPLFEDESKLDDIANGFGTDRVRLLKAGGPGKRRDRS